MACGRPRSGENALQDWPMQTIRVGDNELKYDFVTDMGTGMSSVSIAEGCNVRGDFAIPSEIDGCKVTRIGDRAFRVCRSLTSVTIPEGVTKIGVGAFTGCSSLTSVTMPEGVTSIGDWAFSGCSSLASMAIPASVTSIADNAFFGCDSLRGLSVSNENQHYSSKNGFLLSKDGRTLIRGIDDDEVTTPAGVTEIGENAFSGFSSLTRVAIPEGVAKIREGAFFECSSLTRVTISEGVSEIGEGAFYGCSSLTSVTIPASVTSIGDWAFICFSPVLKVYVSIGDVERVKQLFADSGNGIRGIEFIEMSSAP